MKRKALYIAGASSVLLLFFLVWLLDFPSWQKLDMNKLTDLSQATTVYDSEGAPMACLSSVENRVVIEIEEIPEHVKNAFIAIEDSRFYEHSGIDIRRIGGALLNNLKAREYREGASTITQQLIKLTHLTSEKTLARKAQEAWLAIQLERQAGKEEILEMYLNVVYFGKGAYGIESAAQIYFGKKCRELTLAEGAMLAGLIKAPGVYAPHVDAERAVKRRNTVIQAMLRAEMIDEETANQAMLEEVNIIENQTEAEGWYEDWVLQEASELLSCSVEDVLSGGLQIYTGYREEMQQEAEQLFSEASFFPSDAEDGTRPEAALIALNPENGEILCMIGGRNYSVRRGLNRSTQMKRQPGSAFKPISVYAAAVDLLGYTPVSQINDEERDFGGGYIPSNASGKTYGTVTLRQALVRSMNLAAVDLITKTGVEAAAMYAQRAGIPLNASDFNLSLALGSLTEGVSPAQMSAAYAPLVNGGYSVEAHVIRRIDNAYGKTLYEFRNTKDYVMSDKSARMLTSMLEDAVSIGTASQLSSVGFPVAAKTGTVGGTAGGNSDAWIVAYTPKIALCVWMGFDQSDQHLLAEGTTGGTYPARLAAAFLERTAADSDGGDFSTPDGMKEVLLDGKALEELKISMLSSENTPSQFLLREILPEENLPIMRSPLWEKPARVEKVYIQTDESGAPIVSFIVPDDYSRYRIIRRQGQEEKEVASLEGKAGEFISFIDSEAVQIREAEYYVISRHKEFEACGEIVESEPSEIVLYKAQGLLERFISRNYEALATEEPLFGSDD